jgi:hypothetical protein
MSDLRVLVVKGKTCGRRDLEAVYESIPERLGEAHFSLTPPTTYGATTGNAEGSSW